MRHTFQRARATLLALGLAFGGVSSAAAQLSVDELEIFLRPNSQGGAVGVIRVTNDADRVVQATVDVNDWDRDEVGANRFFPSGTLKQSCRRQLKVFPMSLRLEPHSTETLRVTLENADSLTSCWGIVFVQANEPRKLASGSGITYVIRTGIKVYVEPPNAGRDGVIEDARLNETSHLVTAPDSLSTREVEVAFRNVGAAHLRTQGSLEVRRPDNTVAAKMEIPEFATVPGALRRLKIKLPVNLAPGAYVALAILDYGGQEIAAGQIEFRIR